MIRSIDLSAQEKGTRLVKEIKAILFDLDDTLLDDVKATKNYRQQFYENHQSEIPYSFMEYYSIWEYQVTEDLLNLSKGTTSLFESRINRMRRLFKAPAMETNQACRYVEEYLQLYETSWEIFSDAISSLSMLSQRYPLGIVSNGDKQQQLQKIERFGLMKFFNVIVSCEDAKSSKPQREIFDYAATQTGEKNENILFVGDGYERDIVGSLNAGMTPVWIVRNGNTNGRSIENVTVIRSLNEISSLTILQ